MSKYGGAVSEVIQQIEEETVARHSREGTQPLGIRAVLGQDPHNRPREMKRAWAPAFHAATKAARRELAEAYGWFLEAYRVAAESMRRGNAHARFPEGSFPPQRPFVRWSAELTPG